MFLKLRVQFPPGAGLFSLLFNFSLSQLLVLKLVPCGGATLGSDTTYMLTAALVNWQFPLPGDLVCLTNSFAKYSGVTVGL